MVDDFDSNKNDFAIQTLSSAIYLQSKIEIFRKCNLFNL